MSVDKKRVFVEALQDGSLLSNPGQSIAMIMKVLDATAARLYSDVSQPALSNCHGDWFEWVLSLVLDDVSRVMASCLQPVRLPDAHRFDWTQLYNERIRNLLIDLREEIRATAGVELISSNPDFVLIDPRKLTTSVSCLHKPTDIESCLQSLNRRFEAYVGAVDFGGIAGFVSAKYSLRPDRRLQLPHEGSLVKAMHLHLQTRLWVRNAPPLRFIAVVGSAKDCDLEALKTVATHSVTSILFPPERSVDEVVEVKTIGDAQEFGRRLLTLHGSARQP